MPARSLVRLALIALFLLPLPAAANLFEDVLERGTLRIGVASFVPWTFETTTGDLAGFEIAVGERLAADMGVRPVFRLYRWEEIIAAVQSGEIDMIAAGMAITPSRALEVTFTNPYFESGVALATNTAMTAAIERLPDLNADGIVVATVAETLAFDFAQRFFNRARIIVFDGSDLAEQAVLDGEVHAYVTSLPEARFLALANPTVIDLPLREPMQASRAGFAVRHGEQGLLNYLNAWITARDADRFLATTHAYWFESLDWANDVAKP